MAYRGDLDAWYNKGYALKEQGKLDQAIVAFDKALEVGPEDARIWTITGNSLLELVVSMKKPLMPIITSSALIRIMQTSLSILLQL